MVEETVSFASSEFSTAEEDESSSSSSESKKILWNNNAYIRTFQRKNSVFGSFIYLYFHLKNLLVHLFLYQMVFHPAVPKSELHLQTSCLRGTPFLQLTNFARISGSEILCFVPYFILRVNMIFSGQSGYFLKAYALYNNMNLSFQWFLVVISNRKLFSLVRSKNVYIRILVFGGTYIYVFWLLKVKV